MATMSTKPFLPSPALQTTSQDASGDFDQPVGGSDNFKYIYGFLSVLFGLLCIALLVLLRALIRRRRLDTQFAAFDREPTAEEAAAAAEQQQQRRRRKKRKDYGEKPGFIDAWIGNGPVPTSLSTEALLEVIQPFSVSRATAVGAEASGMSERYPAVQLATESSSVEQDSHQQQKQRHHHHHFLTLPPAPASASSCSHSDEKLSLRAASPPPPISPLQTPQLYEIERVQVGFLIAMPRPPPVPSLKKAASSSTLNVAKDIDGESFWSLAESKWSDHLPEGQLPDLTVGVSTLCVPIERGGSWHD